MKIIRINAMWCGGCLSMHKVWKKIEEEYPKIEIISYDYDMDEEIVKSYEVGTLLPVAIFMKGDKEVARLNGEKTVKEIEEVINQYK